MRTFPNISSHFKRLNDVLTTKFIPSVTVGINCSHNERKLTFLPAKLKGLRIPIFSKIANRKNPTSRTRSIKLVCHLVNKRRRLQSNQAVNIIPNANDA